ncbi:MAG: desulfoferrodoxin [Firmicutes bacterium]|jgi:superoxide reductase|nr:desulfoferrodoxin [Bacillota bacterium]NLY38518.1 desulfoferrodoxin [Bacillota bacterium]
MTALHQIYKCNVCGNVVAVVHASQGQLVCCNQPMELMTENTVDASTEKHVPVAEVKDGKVIVSVGSVLHPMEESHYIEWIELIEGNESRRVFLKPGDEPKAVFECAGKEFKVREYCNLHGLWSS